MSTLPTIPAMARPQPGQLATLEERAVSLERAGAWDEAASAFDRLFRAAVAAGDAPRFVDAVRGRARALHGARRLADASETAELSQVLAALHDLRAAAARATNLRAIVYYSEGRLEEARALYREALETAVEVGDDELIGLVCQNLGVIANIMGDLREAQALYLESIGSCVRTGSAANMVMAYNNLAMVSTDLREWMEAVVYFDRGIEVAERSGNLPQLARLYANRAEPLIHLRDQSQAAASLDRGERLAESLQAQETLTDVCRLRAMHARLEGDLAAARAHAERGLARASRWGLELERGELLEEQALIARAAGHLSEVERYAAAALRCFLTVGALADADRVRETLEELGA